MPVSASRPCSRRAARAGPPRYGRRHWKRGCHEAPREPPATRERTPGGAGTTGDAGTTGEAGTTGGRGSAGTGGSVVTTGTTGATGTAGTGGATARAAAAVRTGAGGSATGGTGGTAPAGPILYTSAPNAYWRPATPTTVTTTADITVNDATTYQTWDGFGGSFNEMGWDNLSMLSASERDRAMKLLFDGTDGARFVFGRIPIGASDFAIDRYTLNETANDFTMANFSIARDRTRLILYIKAALAINPNIRLWASPWTPPTWMKDNKAFDGGNMVDNAQNLQALALYLAKFVQEYGKEGIKIEAIHHQNEPNYATGYPSCLWTPALYTKFIGMYLGPTFASQNVTAQIYLGTMSNADAGKDTTIIGTVLADATALGYIKGFGLQWNMINNVAGLIGTEPADPADRAQVRQLPVGDGDLQERQGPERSRVRRRELGPDPRLAEGRRALVQRLEHGAGHHRQG